MELWIIIGARGLGREMLAQARGDPAHNHHWTIYGFLDSAGPEILPEGMDVPVIGDPMTYEPRHREWFLPAIGNPIQKQKFLAPLIEKGAQFASLRTSTQIGERTQIGKGVCFGFGAGISSDCKIDDFAFVDCAAHVGHDTEIGQYSHIGARVFIGGKTRIGKAVTIHPAASIARGLTIGEGAVIGMGAVVLRDVPPFTSVIGNPARVIGKTEYAPPEDGPASSDD